MAKKPARRKRKTAENTAEQQPSLIARIHALLDELTNAELKLETHYLTDKYHLLEYFYDHCI